MHSSCASPRNRTASACCDASASCCSPLLRFSHRYCWCACSSGQRSHPLLQAQRLSSKAYAPINMRPKKRGLQAKRNRTQRKLCVAPKRSKILLMSLRHFVHKRSCMNASRQRVLKARSQHKQTDGPSAPKIKTPHAPAPKQLRKTRPAPVHKWLLRALMCAYLCNHPWQKCTSMGKNVAPTPHAAI